MDFPRHHQLGGFCKGKVMFPLKTEETNNEVFDSLGCYASRVASCLVKCRYPGGSLECRKTKGACSCVSLQSVEENYNINAVNRFFVTKF